MLPAGDVLASGLRPRLRKEEHRDGGYVGAVMYCHERFHIVTGQQG